MHSIIYDDDDEYIADYIDLVLYAIVSNIERQKGYQSNPTDALLQEILNHSASITRAENCLNIHIRRIIRNFKTSINYDACMLGLDNGANAITTNAAETKQVTTVTNNDDSSSTHFAPAAREIEIEIANEATKTDISNGHNGTTSAEIAIEADITSGNNAEYEVIENTLTHVEIAKEVDITNGNAVRNEVDITNGNAVRNEFGNAVRNEIGNAVRNEFGNAARKDIEFKLSIASVEIAKEVDITNEHAVRNELGNAVRTETEVEPSIASVEITNSITSVEIAKEVDITNEHAVRNELGNAVGTETEVEPSIASVEITNDVDITNGSVVRHDIEIEIALASVESTRDVKAEIEYTKHRISIEIAEAIARTDRMIDATVTNAIGSISQAHDDVPTNWNASMPISLDNHLTEGIAQAQHVMATEIERLLCNLDLGISRLKKGIENMHQQLGISNDSPIDLEIAHKNPSSILITKAQLIPR
jgi:hypothetical protein